MDWNWLPTSFPVPTDDISQQYEVRDALTQRLEVLRCAPARSIDHPSLTQIEGFIGWLLKSQRTVRQGHIPSGSWGIPEDLAIESDAFVDFVLKPTYAAVACLCLVRKDFPALAESLQPSLDRAIADGLRFSRLKNLRGHGYDANDECLDAVRLLGLGKVFSLTRDEERFSQVFADVIDTVERDILEHMPKACDWSRTGGLERQHAVRVLRGGDTNDAIVAPPVHAKWASENFAVYLKVVLRNSIQYITPPAIETAATEMISRLDEARTHFEEIKPKYAVFGSRRSVKGELQDTVAELNVRFAIDLAIGETRIPEWLAPISNRLVERRLIPHLRDTLPDVLTNGLCDHPYFGSEAFSPYVSSVSFDEDGYLYMALGVMG
ncbi:hypothetical protein NYO91_09420 [Arhodomonas aquaeolei]|uniref:hypothetical protein n=1 Tax=Arhodomonas aquaeolei TaxID=2369 RepID=UPI0021682C48|nr:hypothetical protein [Arhodomonas aquaeolei]MCS4504295.1 hypothetical protein [Arhodomonas aquaeolei]